MGLQEAMVKAVAVIYAGRQRRLFSKRRAAKLLGVDRSTTLERMIQNGEMGRFASTVGSWYRRPS